MRTLFLLWTFFVGVFLQAVDFDCVVIGTSPIPMCEAIYQAFLGKRVLLVDQWPQPGGAWKSITACSIPHVDMGCHQLVSADLRVKNFLETYLGCQLVPLQKPDLLCKEGDSCPDFYFSKGCFELLHQLERLIEKTNIVYLLNHSVDTISILPDHLKVKMKDKVFSTHKVITVPCSFFQLEGLFSHLMMQPSISHYWHLYLLLQDPTTPQFSYGSFSYPGICRCMNLTHFVGLNGTGKQLFVFQAYREQALSQKEMILEEMKRKKLVNSSAYILESDLYVYDQFQYYTSWLSQMPPEMRDCFEILDTSTFGAMSHYIPKWEVAMKPFKELFP